MSLTSYKKSIAVPVIILILVVQCQPIGSQSILGVAGPRSNWPEPIEYINEEAVQQKEGVPSHVYGVYDSGHSKLANALHPIPIVDNLREEDKYGNTGGLLDGPGRSLINGFEAFSNLLNHIVDTPVNVTRQISRGITEQLNRVGGKLIGL